MTRPAPAVQPLSIKAEPQNIVVDAAKSALLIVDMQNDFCTEGGWLHSRGIDVSPNRKPIKPLQALMRPSAQALAGDLGQLGRAQGLAEYQSVVAARP